MSSTESVYEVGCPITEVIATSLLDERKSRKEEFAAEGRVTLDLARRLSSDPVGFFASLVQSVIELTSAQSAGISLLDRSRNAFVWPAIAGPMSSYIGQGTPGDFGPCGAVLERNSTMLFQRPEKHFRYLEPVTPALEEVLLAPFHVGDQMVGTVWAVIHDDKLRFDSEDRRLLENLSGFAASAYRVLMDLGEVDDLINDIFAQRTK